METACFLELSMESLCALLDCSAITFIVSHNCRRCIAISGDILVFGGMTVQFLRLNPIVLGLVLILSIPLLAQNLNPLPHWLGFLQVDTKEV